MAKRIWVAVKGNRKRPAPLSPGPQGAVRAALAAGARAGAAGAVFQGEP